MKKNDHVRNEEELYRSVRGKLEEEYSYSPKDSLQISSEAFRDRDRKPSVDRAELRGYDPTLSKLSDTDGVVSLMIADVRGIGIVKTKIQNEDAVDVVYNPTPENPAHSQIIVKPELYPINPICSARSPCLAMPTLSEDVESS